MSDRDTPLSTFAFAAQSLSVDIFAYESVAASGTYESDYYDLGDDWQQYSTIVICSKCDASAGSRLVILASDDPTSPDLPFFLPATNCGVGAVLDIANPSGVQGFEGRIISRYFKLRFENGVTPQSGSACARIMVTSC